MSAPNFTVVVPCYNEEDAIGETIESLQQCLAGKGPYELIVVDDGSTDRSSEILRAAQKENTSLTVVHHAKNRGYGAALKTGIRRASSEIIAITDADGTYPHEQLPELISLAQEADMVVGSRTGTAVKYSWIRRIPKAFLSTYASWLAGRKIPDINSGMRVFRRSVVERFIKLLPDTFSFTMTITLATLRSNYDVRFVPISYAPRVGKSKIHPIKDTMRFCQLIVRTGMYFAPMRVLFPVGLVLLLGFFVSALYDVFVLKNITDKTVLLLMFALNTAMFALLADMIDKRGSD